MPPRKIKWNAGDVFAIPLLNDSFSIGQVLDLQMANVVRIALYDEVINDINTFNLLELCKVEKLISLVATSREQLDYNVWKILGSKDQQIPVSQFPNEQYRDEGWVGAVHYDAAIAEDFMDAFYALLPWDDWGDPDFLDNEFLIDVKKKPKNLLYIK